jgi:hypothetical protein
MDAKLMQIISKAAGTYFLVTDSSQVATIEAESKMRLLFINTPGPVNMLFNFAKGDTAGFISIFGRGTRLQEKKGNFSIATCLEALKAGPIAVINLRAFTTEDTSEVIGLSPNIVLEDDMVVEYSKLFNTNNFWNPEPKNIINLLDGKELLNFGNVGTSLISIIATISNAADVLTLTNEGKNSLVKTSLEIDEYPALDFNMLVQDTFVNVYVFNNDFSTGANTNQYYGQFFDNDGNLDLTRINELIAIPEAGFSKKFIGSLIPNLISENSVNISIDTLINQYYMSTGLIAYINDDLFETDNKFLLDMKGYQFFNGTTIKVAETSNYLLSHVVPQELTELNVIYPLTSSDDNIIPANYNEINYGCEKIDEYSFKGSFEQGLRIGDYIQGTNNNLVTIDSVLILTANKVIDTSTYTEVKYTCSEQINYNLTIIPEVPANGNIPAISSFTKYSVKKINSFTKIGIVKPFKLTGYTPRSAQFTDGTSATQNSILDMINSLGITKGIKATTGIRYVVDCFKSFVEPNYKYQYGILMDSLDQSNNFVRAILNEPFIEDLQKSVNPLFKQIPTDNFDWSYVPDGGNKTFSSILLSKFNLGAYMCFYFGPGNIVGSVTRPVAGLVSNLFYGKTIPYDVLANTTGYLDGISQLESAIDDEDRAFCEKFLYNPIINFNGGPTIFQNLTGQKTKTSLQQIHNSELLCYIKESLTALGKSEAFKKGNYDDYLRLETETTNFMNDLVLAGAVYPNIVVICDATNNTTEIAKNKMKLVHIEYTAVDSLDKVVFDLKLN